MKEEKLEAFSWTITEESYCIKRMDKSLYKYGETVIPIKIRNYFNIENNGAGDKVIIKILYKGKMYEEIILFENNFNRSKLKIEKELHLKILEDLKKINGNLKYQDYNILFIFKPNEIFDSFKLEVVLVL